VAWVVAAVVTVALVAAGVLVARGGRERSPAVLPAMDLDAASAAGAAAKPAPAGVRGAEPARPYDTGDAQRLWPPVTYKLPGPLPTLPDRSRAWKVADDTDAARVAALAAAFGLRGQPKEEPSGWTVRDGRRTLTVNRLAGLPWTYGVGLMATCVARPGGGPYRPGAGLQCLDADSPVPVRPSRPVDLPSREQAERIARDLAARAGLDLDGAQVGISDAYAARLASISPAIGGLPTSGFGWRVSVGSKGSIQHASGFLATPEPADAYPLIGVEEGFERLKKTPPLGPLLRADAPAIERDPCPAGSKVPCAAKPLPARVATVAGVRLGLQLAPAVPEGNRPAEVAYLLPAYLFDLEGGWTDIRSVVAVQDRYLTRP
jgi:hypothetical protein